ncbi:MAG: hypothetical protein AAGI37_17395 [Planctomycetota bacterium]
MSIMPRRAILFIAWIAICIGLPGCTADQNEQATAKADASERVKVAETQVNNAKETIKQFLVENDHIFDWWDLEGPEIELRRRTSALELEQITESRDALALKHKQLIKHKEEGDYKPSDTDKVAIESSDEIVELDGSIGRLRVQLEALVNRDEERLANTTAKVKELLATRQAQREKVYKQKVQLLLDSQIAQAGMGLQILDEEILRLKEAISIWTDKRRLFIEHKQKYDSLTANLRAAERQRDAAMQALASLNSRPH